MQIAKLNADGQVTLPEDIRNQLGLQEGDELMFFQEGLQIRMRVLRPRRLSEFYGALPATRPYPGREAVRKEVGKQIAEKILSEGT